MRFRYQLWGAIAFGVAARLLFAIVPGKTIAARWSGGSDAPAYILLAHNVANGRGLTYCGMPDAIRPPLYPLLLGRLVAEFGGGFAIAIRLLQFAAGLATALLCYEMAKCLWDKLAALLAAAAVLLLPALVYLTGEIMTETFAALVVAVFWFLLLRQFESPRPGRWALIGVVVGMATLVRFNLAVLGIFAVCILIWKSDYRAALRATLVITAAACLTIAPWVMRNQIQFHGRVLLSSQTGYNMVEGLLTPQGRAMPGDSDRLIQAEGWAQSQIETNDSSRLAFPDEGELNARATKVAIRLWRNAGFSALPVVLEKLGYFWLQIDQLTWYPGWGHWARMAGVLMWWLMLVCAIAGWSCLKQENHHVANALLFYAFLVTVLHIPFVMNTRLAAPLLAPLICFLLPGATRLSQNRGSRDASEA